MDFCIFTTVWEVVELRQLIMIALIIGPTVGKTFFKNLVRTISKTHVNLINKFTECLNVDGLKLAKGRQYYYWWCTVGGTSNTSPMFLIRSMVQGGGQLGRLTARGMQVGSISFPQGPSGVVRPVAAYNWNCASQWLGIARLNGKMNGGEG